jgi:hypothetical protein
VRTVTLKQAREDFDAVIAAGKSEAVEIVQNGERIGLFLTDADADLIEDLLLAQRATEARQGGTIGEGASAALLNRLRNVED